MGLGRSGYGAIHLLKKFNYEIVVTINDSLSLKDKDNLSGIKVFDNGHPLSLLDEDFAFIVKNPGIKYSIPFIQEALKKGIKIITEIELAYNLTNNTYLAITGTNGKTTVTTLVYDIIKEQLAHVLCAGNIGTALSEVVCEYGNDNIIVTELSSFQLMGIDKFKPHIATILNLAPDHLDYMPTLESYYESKLSIYQNMNKDDYFLLNIDDTNVVKYVKNINCNIITFSLMKKADIYLKDNNIFFKDELIMNTNEIKIIGQHNLANILVAVGFAKLMNIDNCVIKKVINNFKGVEYRLELVNGLNNNTYYNDSKATTPDSTITALKALSNKELVLILGGFDKGLDNNLLINYINDHHNIISVYAYGQIKDKFNDIKVPLNKMNSLNEVVKDILNKYHDINILFSPATSSYDQYDNYEVRGAHFNKLIRGDNDENSF
jgi:UDP-N-acetylmuramoylalanine--D-glutamate ligase